MRSWIAVVALAILSLARPVVAQSAFCADQPRWLLVTVDEYRIIRPEVFETREESDGGQLPFLSVDRFRGPRLVETCKIVNVVSDSSSGSPKAVIELQREKAADPFILLFLVETPQAICTALPDCTDTTGQ